MWGGNMVKCVRLLERIVKFFSWFGIIFMVILMMVILSNVILRFFNLGINGAYEIAQHCLVGIVWFGVPLAALKNDMIELDIIKFSRGYMLVIRLISAAMCVLIGICTIIQGNIARLLGSASTVLKIPRHPFQWITALGFFLIVFAIAVYVYDNRKDNQNQYQSSKPKQHENYSACR